MPAPSPGPIAPRDAALGAVLGALVGDAAGAVLEFFGREITHDDVAHALTMPGGGTWAIAPGQVTDDGELTLSLLRALADANERDGAGRREAAATRYAAWVSSGPFDMGATTAASLGCLRRPEWRARAEVLGVAGAMTEAAHARCMASKANGSLMRITPLGVWGARRAPEVVVQAAAEDARLSHPNPACVDAACVYVLAIATLVRTGGDARAALEEATTWARTSADPEVRGWLDEALAGVRVPFSPQDGFVRIGFTHAFRHLALGTRYDDAIAETLLGGGDTDTNAAIVGGLLGARWGAEGIPTAWRERVLGCDTTEGAHPRGRDLHPGDVPALVTRVLGG
jgi:ADP-ribosylglycohydrolase